LWLAERNKNTRVVDSQMEQMKSQLDTRCRQTEDLMDQLDSSKAKQAMLEEQIAVLSDRSAELEHALSESRMVINALENELKQVVQRTDVPKEQDKFGMHIFETH